MTKEEWEKVEKALSGTYGFATLQVDGRKVEFQRGLISKNKLGIITFVDGVWKARWMLSSEEHPEQKYLRPVTRFLHGAKFRAALKKTPKRLLKRMDINLDEKRHSFSVVWPSVTAIRRHYQKTFTSIELIKVVG